LSHAETWRKSRAVLTCEQPATFFAKRNGLRCVAWRDSGSRALKLTKEIAQHIVICSSIRCWKV